MGISTDAYDPSARYAGTSPRKAWGGTMLDGAHQDVTLATGGELQRARRIEVRFAHRRGVAGDRLVVQPAAAALDQLARLVAAFRQAGLVQELEGGDAGG